MQALFQVPAGEGRVPGTVDSVVKSAYMLNDRLIRAAMVGVVEGSYVDPNQKKKNNNEKDSKKDKEEKPADDKQ